MVIKIGLVGINSEEKCLTFVRNERKTAVPRQRFLNSYRGGGGPDDQVVSEKRAVEERMLKSRRIIDEKKEKAGPRTDPGGIRRPLKRSNFCDFEKLRKRTYRKERLSLMNKAVRNASRNKSMGMSGMPDGVKSLTEVNCCKNLPRRGLGMLNPSDMDRERNRN